MRPSIRTLLILPVGAGAFVFGASACVDLFHSTDFATLCDLDAAACATDGGGPRADAGDTPDGDGGRTIDFCKQSQAEAFASAQNACARIGACLGSNKGSGYASCFARALAAYDCSFNPTLRPRGASEIRWDCLAKSASCSDVERCVLGGPKPTCPKFGAGSFSQCSGDQTLVVCGGPEVPVSVESCALRGQKCTAIDTSTARCTGGKELDCDASTGCYDTSAIACDVTEGIASDNGIDCAQVGAGQCTRRASGSRAALCVPGDLAHKCEEQTSASVNCRGTVAELCVDKLLVRIDCSSLGEACDTDALPLEPAAACHRVPDAGAGCSFTEDRCNGSTLESCRNGTELSVDCAKVPGMKTCGVSASGWATCKP